MKGRASDSEIELEIDEEDSKAAEQAFNFGSGLAATFGDSADELASRKRTAENSNNIMFQGLIFDEDCDKTQPVVQQVGNEQAVLAEKQKFLDFLGLL